MKIATLNCENMFLTSNDLPTVGTHNYIKTEEKVQKLAKAILDISADVYCLQEVGGEASLKILCKEYLQGSYTFAFLKGNSQRNIHVAYLIKDSFKLSYEVVSNKDRPLDFSYESGRPSELISRDILEFHILQAAKPLLILLGVHLKSQLDSDGVDPKGTGRRKGEMNLLAKISNSYKKQYPQCPQIILGDFNNMYSEDLDEFRDFKTSCPDFTDILELLHIAPNLRGTHMHFDEQGTRLVQQLDYILVDSSLQDAISMNEGGIYRYKDEKGVMYPLPDSNLQRYVMASDHFPVVCSFKFSL